MLCGMIQTLIMVRRRLTPLFLVTAVATLLSSSPAHAALLYLQPTSGTYQPGETVGVDIRLDNEGECINAGDITLSYPRSLVEAIDVSRGESIFSLWIAPPAIHQDLGLVSMVGGVPGGFCGRTPGDPAVTNVLAKVIFRFAAQTGTNVPPQEAAITITKESRLVLNDGRGTLAPLTTKNARFVIAHTGKPQKNEWTEALAADTTPPEEFSAEIHTDPNLFEGRYFAVFSTLDKQTGLDHYEILELPARPSGNIPTTGWQRAEVPYVLKDQTLRGVVFIRALDKAGNVRLVEATMPAATGKASFWTGWNFWLFAGLAITFIALARLVRLFFL